MSFIGASLDHRAYLLFAVLTHAAIGYALVTGAGNRARRAGVAGAVLPDVDLFFPPEWSFPFVHRGLTHTPLFGAAVVAAVGAWAHWRSTGQSPAASRSSGRVVSLAVALGYGSHLVVDSLTVSGVPWLYPLDATGYGVDLAVHSTEHGAVIWGVLGALWVARRRRSADDGGS